MPPSPCSESSWLVILGWWRHRGGRHITQMSSLAGGLTPAGSSNTASPCAIFFLLHFFPLLFLDSPSSGDDEDDDDESEDTGNLFLWDTEIFPLQEMWLPCGVAHLDICLDWRQLFVTLKLVSLGQEYKLFGPGSRNLEIDARVVQLLRYLTDIWFFQLLDSVSLTWQTQVINSPCT